MKLKPSITSLFAFFILALLVVVSYFFWSELGKRFPALEAGSYIGELRGVIDDGGSPVKVYVESPAERAQLLFVLLRRSWDPQYIEPIEKGSSKQDSEWFEPIMLVGSEAKLKLIGSNNGSGHYSGTMTDLETGSNGTWEIERIEPKKSTQNQSETEQIRLWLELRAQQIELESKIESAEKLVATQKEEIERLSQFITEEDKLKSKADIKLKEEKEGFTKLQDELNKKKIQMKALMDQFELVRKVTAAGKLVTLSRESMERESRWANSMLRGTPGNSVDEVQLAFEKGEKIIELRRLILEEKDKMDELLKSSAERRDFGERRGIDALD